METLGGGRDFNLNLKKKRKRKVILQNVKYAPPTSAQFQRQTFIYKLQKQQKLSSVTYKYPISIINT